MFGGEYPADRQPHTGIFTGCSGDLNVQYLGATINVRTVENYILDEYRFRDISFMTWQEFAQNFRNTWNRYFPVLANNLAHVEEFTVIDSKETILENSTTKNEATRSGTAEARFSDTPHQYVPDTFDGLTTLSQSDGSTTDNSEIAHGSTTEIDRGGNAFERWLELSEKNYNMLYNFIDKFKDLFINTYSIRRM